MLLQRISSAAAWARLGLLQALLEDTKLAQQSHRVWEASHSDGLEMQQAYYLPRR